MEWLRHGNRPVGFAWRDTAEARPEVHLLLSTVDVANIMRVFKIPDNPCWEAYGICCWGKTCVTTHGPEQSLYPDSRQLFMLVWSLGERKKFGEISHAQDYEVLSQKCWYPGILAHSPFLHGRKVPWLCAYPRPGERELKSVRNDIIKYRVHYRGNYIRLSANILTEILTEENGLIYSKCRKRKKSSNQNTKSGKTILQGRKENKDISR